MSGFRKRAAAAAAAASGIESRGPARRLRTGRPRSLPQKSVREYLEQVESCAPPASASGSPPLRPRLPGRVARGDRALRRRRRAAAAHPRGRAAEGDRGVPCRARLPADRAPRARGCLSERTTIVHATHASGAELDLIAPTGRRSARARPRRPTSATASFPPSGCARAAFRSASAPTRTCASIPSRNSVSWRGIARRQTGRRGVFSRTSCMGFGREVGARSLGVDAWPEIEVDLGHRSLRASSPSTCSRLPSRAAAADVVVS